MESDVSMSVALWFDSILSGNHHPAIILLALLVITFLLEDVAIAAGVALATQGVVGWTESFFAVAFGIAIGDLGLYGLGRLALKCPWLYERYVKKRNAPSKRLESFIINRFAFAIFMARIIPGMRFLTYFYTGFIKAPFAVFTVWVFLAVAVWTASLYLLSLSLGKLIENAIGIPLAIAVMIPMLFLAVIAYFLGSRKQKDCQNIQVSSF